MWRAESAETMRLGLLLCLVGMIGFVITILLLATECDEVYPQGMKSAEGETDSVPPRSLWARVRQAVRAGTAAQQSERAT